MALQLPDDAENAAAARMLRASVAARATIDEAVGILQGRHGLDAEQAFRALAGGAGVQGTGAEAARVAAVADAAAEGGADPDYGDWA
ncbi:MULTISPECIES: ANTAR domain-containing protein [Amycolatopsis]|uniref:ANTAR domain-containing protein n=1 Tax=Amycolatopsis dendrobii TaxID=2760662 RepID=A0A7W3ZES2_9PSEU|nr:MULTISPECIES: ANTAR domain-containing protein [Amycolatopsis]MBB1158352.1 ANTAR domain-containing protein [Amycolatopsis dendrobii]UKD56854.1 ANTAR domain-containing protein [Amycolatopsis sp. FU40]